MPTFSIIVPAYQAAETIGRAISSALAQTRPPEEIVVCDDGSTDDLEAALAAYRDRVILVRQENRGLNAARNAAISASSGEWIALLDADDEWLPDRLAEIEAAVASAEDGVDIVTTDAICRAPDRADWLWYEQTTWPATIEAQPKAIIEGNFIFVGAAIRRSAIEQIGLFALHMPHDGEYEAWVRLVLSGSRALLVNKPLAIYHQGGGNQLSDNRSGTLRAIEEVLDRATGRYGPDMDAAISRRKTVLAMIEGAAAIRRRDRIGCVRVCVSRRRVPAATRAKFALAALAPGLAARRLPN